MTSHRFEAAKSWHKSQGHATFIKIGQSLGWGPVYIGNICASVKCKEKTLDSSTRAVHQA